MTPEQIHLHNEIVLAYANEFKPPPDEFKASISKWVQSSDPDIHGWRSAIRSIGHTWKKDGYNWPSFNMAMAQYRREIEEVGPKCERCDRDGTVQVVTAEDDRGIKRLVKFPTEDKIFDGFVYCNCQYALKKNEAFLKEPSSVPPIRGFNKKDLHDGYVFNDLKEMNRFMNECHKLRDEKEKRDQAMERE